MDTQYETLLAPKILRWLLDFGKFVDPCSIITYCATVHPVWYIYGLNAGPFNP